jgi:hypothetical protein
LTLCVDFLSKLLETYNGKEIEEMMSQTDESWTLKPKALARRATAL